MNFWHLTKKLLLQKDQQLLQQLSKIEVKSFSYDRDWYVADGPNSADNVKFSNLNFATSRKWIYYGASGTLAMYNANKKYKKNYT